MKKLAFLVIMLITTTFFLLPSEILCNIELKEGFDIRVFLSGSPFTNIFGLAASSDGYLYVSDFGKEKVLSKDFGKEAIFEINLVDMCTKTILKGAPLYYPARILVGDGSDLVGTNLIVSDWNTVGNSDCCDGMVLSIDRANGSSKPLARANPGFPPVGDPFGIALGTGELSGWLYVMDWEGAAGEDLPVLYRIKQGEAPKVVLIDPQKWTSERMPRDIVFGKGSGFGNDLYVADTNYSGLGTIWRVTSARVLEKFVEGTPDKMPSPESIEFGPGGDFGTNMYVLDCTQGRIFTVSPDKKISDFASGLPKSAGYHDMTFSPDGKSLFVGIKDTIFEIFLKK